MGYRKKGADMKLDFLKKLNTKAVVLIIVAVVLVIGGGTALALSSGQKSGEISEQEAKTAAFAHAGVSESDIVALKVSKGTEDGSPVYEIAFKTADKSYDYDVARNSGEILNSSFDAVTSGIAGTDPANTSDDLAENTPAPSPETTQTPATSPQASQSASTSAITKDKAKSIALEDAGVKEADTEFLWVKEDYDDGRAIYEVEFYAKGKEYDYDIEKSTGKILSSDFDIENYTPGNGNSGNANGTSGEILSLDKARSLALARVPGATEQDIRIQLDRDDGRQVYEGEIYYNRMEYEFEMDAATGNFIEWSAENWD